MSDYIITPDGELYHYGVKGMKWGHRKRPERSDLRKRYDSAKSAMRESYKKYSKSFDEAYNKSISAYSPVRKHRENNAKRWETASKDAERYASARDKYKEVKKERKTAIKNTYKKIQGDASVKDRLVYNNATRKKAAKYVVDNNMSIKDATKKANSDARRNTAILLGAYGAIAVGTLIAQNR